MIAYRHKDPLSQRNMEYLLYVQKCLQLPYHLWSFIFFKISENRQNNLKWLKSIIKH